MVHRPRLSSISGGIYFANTDSSVKFVSTGCTVLDMVLGGGWPLGRVVNVVGDQSSGKTLLAIEGMANFAVQYKEGKIQYDESEAAFVPAYAGSLGLPLARVEFSHDETVEGFYSNLSKFLKKLDGQPGFYVLDSLDALSDEAEMGRDLSEGTYGVTKAKQMSQLFRRITSQVETSQVCLMLISQTRDRINAGFGRRYTRSGGRALDFYASVVLYLAHIKELFRTVKGVKRSVGVEIKARCTKNKIGLPFRSCTFPVIFGYGIENISAGLDWLEEHKMLEKAGYTVEQCKDLRSRALRIALDPNEHLEVQTKVSTAVLEGWKEVEMRFLPKRSKYGGL